ncbi:YozE family protein [Ureibacillus sp. Re31]|uniref:YozE family protein n=1 Tax=Ureibacillus galli TaxID=2762222 RepID=A0ABR8X736_9BACL|nr:YozE family protein [Ureibacillus galli]MBD8025104.1 YozE family protein [Ureibacillus galli]
MRTSFYLYVLSFRGGDWNDPKTRFAERAFLDHSFPITSSSFEELSSYIETMADEHLTTQAFDELWDLYEMKFG